MYYIGDTFYHKIDKEVEHLLHNNLTFFYNGDIFNTINFDYRINKWIFKI
jgi:hypothetical protein